MWSALFFWSMVATAQANGQTTHLWITWEAVELLPEGDLKTLLSDESNHAMLGNGTMFPDGGYAVDHDYGETAHWEPFQSRFAEWILETFDGAFDGEAAPYWAFYFGMTSHGMADEFFDSLYMERSKVYDADAWSDGQTLDVSSDFVWASLTGAQTPPELWIPDSLAQLFADHGVDVDRETLESGQTMLAAAIDLVGLAGSDPAYAETHASIFPWACSHLDSETVPGAPLHEATVVALYWEALWAQWHGDPDLRVIATVPDDGSLAHSDAAEDVESRVSVVFSRGMTDDASIQEELSITSNEGTHHFEADLFYGQSSHVVNLHATEGWAPDAEHVVKLSAEITSSDGAALGGERSFTFSTAEELVTESTCGCHLVGVGTSSFLWAFGCLGLSWRRRCRIE